VPIPGRERIDRSSSRSSQQLALAHGGTRTRFPRVEGSSQLRCGPGGDSKMQKSLPARARQVVGRPSTRLPTACTTGRYFHGDARPAKKSPPERRTATNRQRLAWIRRSFDCDDSRRIQRHRIDPPSAGDARGSRRSARAQSRATSCWFSPPTRLAAVRRRRGRRDSAGKSTAWADADQAVSTPWQAANFSGARGRIRSGRAACRSRGPCREISSGGKTRDGVFFRAVARRGRFIRARNAAQKAAGSSLRNRPRGARAVNGSR